MGYKQYCKNPEKIENYEKALADNFKGWCCHHRLETWNSDGLRRPVDITRAELKALDMYYNRPAEELIFLRKGEHNRLHHKGKHYPVSEETRKKLSDAGKGKPKSEEARKKMSEAKKGKYTGENNSFYGKHHTEESKKKISEAKKGKYTGENHPMYGKTHSEEARRKMSEARKGIRWFNNGKINIMARECPEGFVPGRLLI